MILPVRMALVLAVGIAAGFLSSRLPRSEKAALAFSLAPLVGLYLLLPLC